MTSYKLPDLKDFAAAVVGKIGTLLDNVSTQSPIRRAYDHFKEVAEGIESTERKHRIKQARHEVSYARRFYLSDSNRPMGVNAPKPAEIEASEIIEAALNSVPEFALK